MVRLVVGGKSGGGRAVRVCVCEGHHRGKTLQSQIGSNWLAIHSYIWDNIQRWSVWDVSASLDIFALFYSLNGPYVLFRDDDLSEKGVFLGDHGLD